MKIAILGTRGIPNNHGGFEQFAEYFSLFLANNNHDVYVYNSHDHPFQKKEYKGVKIIHCFDYEYKIGTAGQFIYDLNCILDSRKRNFDIILQLGYTSSSIWHWLMPRGSLIVTNMDGLEWKRTKYNPYVRRFLKFAEKLGALKSDYLIADSVGIQNHLKEVYGKESKFIPYGADLFNNENDEVLKKYNLVRGEYNMIIARLEPENNIETIIEGHYKSKLKNSLIIFGGLNKYGVYLKENFKDDERIQFLGSNYNQEELNNLRYYSKYYFHGHSVGGTNPSLLEAMSSNALIVAHDNIFNKSILGNEAYYFKDSKQITQLLNSNFDIDKSNDYCRLNRLKIYTKYSWDIINEKYNEFLLKLLN